MGAEVYLKTTCKNCGGEVEFLEEQEGLTVICPQCSKELFLYRSVHAAGASLQNQQPASQHSSNEAKYRTFSEVPWFRREPGPITFLLALIFMPILLAICIVALTGDIYRNAYDQDGKLIVWGTGNKVAAVVILVIEFVIFPFLFHQIEGVR
ncbi:MAG TPA: hypothetical protein VGI03_04750 [Verrucomicrobiae bacterium]|jgi:DNA-directed RNA polymerase subunit RPC12/RpoP